MLCSPGWERGSEFMWKHLFELGKQILSLTRMTQQNEVDVKQLREEMKDVRQELRALILAVQQMHFDMRHDRDMAARDREKLILRLENYLLR